MNLNLLIAIRTNKGYSQEQMAHLLGYRNKASYSLIEAGKTRVNIELANKLRNILNLNENEIMRIFFAN